MLTRTSMLRRSLSATGLLALTGLLPGLARAYSLAAFDARTLPELLASLGGSVPVENPLLRLSGPDVAENGASVPLGISASLAGVSTLLLLVDSNPTALLALFRPLQGVEPDFSLQLKLVESSEIYAVALMSDGKAYFARKPIQVVKGACGAWSAGPPTAPAGEYLPEPIRIRAKQVGDRVVVRALVSHEMESGQREDGNGGLVPAHFIEQARATLNGQIVFTAEWGPWVAKNPVLRFELRGARPGDTIGLSWRDNRGHARSDQVHLN
jgi:sulfur-oxidizing protein SoxY